MVSMAFYLFFWLIFLMVFILLCDKIHPKWMNHRGMKNDFFIIFLYEIQLMGTTTKRMKKSHSLADGFHPFM
jgi:hypothetical protein